MEAILALICCSVSSCRVSYASRRIADLGRAAAHQNDWAMSGLLQAAQQHDLHQVADMQAVGRGIKTDIGRNHAGIQLCIQPGGICYLVQVAALAQCAEIFSLEWTHYARTL